MKLKKLPAYEISHSVSGKPPLVDGPNVGCYVARVVEGDARKAEGYVETFAEIDILQKIRTYLARGLFSEAALVLETISGLDLEAGLFAEFCLESCRLAAFKGEWAHALNFSSKALASEPTGPTQMTLRQVRALSFYELGEWSLAEKELSKAASIAKLFPVAGLSFYLDATSIKVSERLGSGQKAKALLASSWLRLKKSRTFNADPCLTLLRSELDLTRASSETASPVLIPSRLESAKSVARLAFATWLLARAMGYRLYEHLAVLDLHFALSVEVREQWADALSAALLGADRVLRLYNEAVQAQSPTSSTSAELLRSTKRDPGFAVSPDEGEKIKTLLFLRQGIRIDLETLRTSVCVLSPQVSHALRVLAAGAIDKERFFQAVWGSQKFSPHLHDDVIRRLLHRIRTVCSIDVVTKELRIHLPDAFVVDV